MDTSVTHKKVLEIQQLRTWFSTRQGVARAVDGVSFTINEGETFALVGESGCGKSITALSIIQLIPEQGYIAGGTIRLLGEEILKLSESEKRMIRGSRISMIFQEPMTSLNPVYTIGSQVSDVISLHRKLGSSQARQEAIAMLARVGIPHLETQYKNYPHQLSGGMKQRVMIASAVACNPDLLIADEPTTALDVTIQAQILSLIRELRDSMKTAVLLITHDLSVVFHNADQVGIMYAGQIVESSSCAELFKNPLHPYTYLLFRSIPSRQNRGTRLEAIKGTVPRAADFPPGCRFQARCPYAMDKCFKEMPVLIEPEPGHTVACHLFASKTDSLTDKIIHVEQHQHDNRKTSGTKPDEKSVLLSVKDLRTYYPIKRGILKRTVGWVKAVDGLTLEINKGQTLALVGESGCGKTTAGKSMVQLIHPDHGQIVFEGQSVTKLRGKMLRKHRNSFQIIFQDPYSSLNPRMIAGDIIEEGIKVHFPKITKEQRQKRVSGMLQKVGLEPDMALRYPHEFSGGQRQRVAIARALAVEPDFIVCDEAVSALDVSVQSQILNLLKDLQAGYGLAYLFVTHNIGVVEYIADQVAVMYLGRIVEIGQLEEVLDSPKHPYTQSLLSAVPRLEDTAWNPVVLKGDVPSPANPPSGCHFHPRCPKRLDYCHTEYPGYTFFSSSHQCCCYLYGKGTQVHNGLIK